jgi:GH18 family chitinase
MSAMQLILVFLTFLLLTSCTGNAVPLSSPEPKIPGITFVTPELSQPTPQSSLDFPVIGYFPDYRVLNPDWAKNLTDIIYFSAEPRVDGSLDTSRLTEDNWRQLHEWKTQYRLRVHISIGGWERIGGFVDMSTDPETRRIFIENLLHFVLYHDLDGVDFDWEFPETDGQFANYIALLTETRAVFSERGLLVSVALPSESSFPLGGFVVVDRVHIMSYDRGEKHATYEQAVLDVQLFLDAGIPADKLILGLPFYGRTTSPPYKALSYGEITSMYFPAPDVDEVNGLYFNGLETIQKKMCYGMETGLGGFMVWELAQDTTDAASLLQRIYQLAKGNRPC